MHVFVDLAGTRRLGHVVKVNTHTTWVKVMRGAKTYAYIKRHNIKHNLKIHWGGDKDEPIHTSIRHTFTTD